MMCILYQIGMSKYPKIGGATAVSTNYPSGGMPCKSKCHSRTRWWFNSWVDLSKDGVATNIRTSCVCRIGDALHHLDYLL